MKIAEVRLKNGKHLHGYISKIIHEESKFRLLTQTDVGLLGSDNAGQEILFSECDGVYYRTGNGEVFDSDNQIPLWRRYAARCLRGCL